MTAVIKVIHKGEPDKEALKASMVQEAEVVCLTTIDAKFALPVGVNHLSKGLTAAETLAIIVYLKTVVAIVATALT